MNTSSYISEIKSIIMLIIKILKE